MYGDLERVENGAKKDSRPSPTEIIGQVTHLDTPAISHSIATTSEYLTVLQILYNVGHHTVVSKTA